MKTPLLLLALLGSGTAALGQTQITASWQLVNTSFAVSSASYEVLHIQTVSPTVVWSLAREAVPQAVITTYMRSTDGAIFDFGAVVTSSTPLGPDYHPNCLAQVAPNTAVATLYKPTGGGEISRTINGGIRWTKVSTAAQLTGPTAAANWVHMFDATTGVVLGNPSGGAFEVLRTMNGGLTWQGIPAASSVAPIQSNEVGVHRSFFALGTTL
jgi:hypothetical protein